MDYNSVKVPNMIFNVGKKMKENLRVCTEIFHKIIKSKKFHAAVKKLVQTMSFDLSNQELNSILPDIFNHLACIEPILVKEVLLNGMISPDGNFFINIKNLGPNALKNIKDLNILNEDEKVLAIKISLISKMCN